MMFIKPPQERLTVWAHKLGFIRVGPSKWSKGKGFRITEVSLEDDGTLKVYCHGGEYSSEGSWAFPRTLTGFQMCLEDTRDPLWGRPSVTWVQNVLVSLGFEGVCTYGGAYEYKLDNLVVKLVVNKDYYELSYRTKSDMPRPVKTPYTKGGIFGFLGKELEKAHKSKMAQEAAIRAHKNKR